MKRIISESVNARTLMLRQGKMLNTPHNIGLKITTMKIKANPRNETIQPLFNISMYKQFSTFPDLEVYDADAETFWELYNITEDELDLKKQAYDREIQSLD